MNISQDADPISLLEGLLRCYSPSGQEESAVQFLVEKMNYLGFQSHIDQAGNAVGVLGEGSKKITLLGHIDTVPGFIELQRQDDILYGRGAVDAKGPLCCFVGAAAKTGKREGWTITVVGAVGEEADSPGAKYIATQSPPDFAIIGEPSGWDRITLGYKGSLWSEYSIERPLTHTAAREESACEAAIHFWNRLDSFIKDFNQDRSRVFEQLTPTLREMNSSSDHFSETARLKIGIRLPLDITVDEAARLLESLANNANIKCLDGVPAYRADKNSALVRAFLASIRKNKGEPRFSLKSGTADFNIVGPVWNCPIVAYGPGDSDLDHTPEEHILISEYEKSIDILSDVIMSITS